ncbi:MAG TPA: tetratricopeptide repeat protein [Candidatus Sulfotelmatobacter sp.]|nr:tetratricopeptide repeat protein [Candidatus Sulfotelmatobacter sp.]
MMLVASFALATALVSAQTAEFDALRHKAEAGDAKAQFDLADAYSEGKGVAKDSAKGMEWLKKSALQGYAGAQVVLGYFYQKGINREKDPSEAAKWYRKAAKQSDKDLKHAQTAQNHLSEMLAEGSISAKEADWHASDPSTTIARQPKTNKSPFSVGEVETGLIGGITSKRMATLVNTYGVDFSLSASTRKRLTDKGADDSLLATIASSKR